MPKSYRPDGQSRITGKENSSRAYFGMSIRRTIRELALKIGTLNTDDERDEEDKLRREGTRSRASFTAERFKS